MGSLVWLGHNWFTLLNATGVVGGLLFTGYALHSESKTRKVANLLTLTQSHRSIWELVLKEPHLQRVLEETVDTQKFPPSMKEAIFVGMVIQHLSMVFHSMHSDLTISPDGLRRDIWQFFSLPVPSAVWHRLKSLQNDDFVGFVESCMNWK